MIDSQVKFGDKVHVYEFSGEYVGTGVYVGSIEAKYLLDADLVSLLREQLLILM